MAIERISVNFGGIANGAGGTNATISANGRYVVYIGDATGRSQVQLYDAVKNEYRILTQLGQNTPPLEAAIAGDYVVYSTTADNVALGDTNGLSDVYVIDLKTMETKLVSTAAADVSARFTGAVSSDGTNIAFIEESALSIYDNMVVVDWKSETRLYESNQDAQYNVTYQVRSIKSITNSDATGFGYPSFVWVGSQFENGVRDSYNGTHFGDPNFQGNYDVAANVGRHVQNVMSTSASDYGSGFGMTVVDGLTSQTIRLGNFVSDQNIFVSELAISDDGKYVAFVTNYDVLDQVLNDNRTSNFAIYVWKVDSGTRNPDGTWSGQSIVQITANGGTENSIRNLEISEDGRFITFHTDLNNIVPGDTDGQFDVFRADNPLFPGSGGADPSYPNIIEGTPGQDVLIGSGTEDLIRAYGDDDEARGWGGDDTVIGGDGGDTLYGGAGDDKLHGDMQMTLATVNAVGANDGIDYLSGGEGNDTVYGGGGDDSLFGDENFLRPGPDTDNPGGDDILYGGAGEDFLIGQGQNDYLYGGADNDTIHGDLAQLVDDTERVGDDDGSDNISGGAGDDKAYGGGGEDTLFGDANRDVQEVVSDALHGTDDLYGGAGNDFIYGQGKKDNLYGGSGSDTIFGDELLSGLDELNLERSGDGGDSISGGGGDDRAYGGGGEDTLFGDANRDVQEEVRPQDHGTDYLHGGAGNDFIYGQGAKDNLYGGNGDDTIFGDELIEFFKNPNEERSGDGGDNISGGSGDDHVYGGGGGDSIYGDRNSEGEEVPAAEHGKDYLHGGAGNDFVYGQGNIDTMYGGAGNDTLYGDARDGISAKTESDGENVVGEYDAIDNISGGTGDDTIFGGGGGDVLYGDKNNLDPSGDIDVTSEMTHGSDTIYGGAGKDDIEGQGGGDTIWGGQDDDKIYGDVSLSEATQNDKHRSDGKDIIYGGHGNDIVYGGGEDDIIFGDFGQVDGQSATSIEYEDAEGGAAESWYLKGGNDELYGGAGNDKLFGGAGDDQLFGGDGDDILNAGSGSADAITGGDGDDTIIGWGNVDQENLKAGATASKRSMMFAAEAVDDAAEAAAANRSLAADAAPVGSVLDGGAGDDTIMAGAGATVIGGEGSDRFMLKAGNGDVTIADFAGGASGDTIDVAALVSGAEGFDGETNPFATGHLKLETRGTSTVLLFDADGAAGPGEAVEISVIENTAAASVTTANLTAQGTDILALDATRTSLTRGTDGGDTLTGTDGNDTLDGGAGDDVIRGGAGADDLMGRAGADQLFGEAGDDVLSGGDGDDVLEGGAGDDVIRGGGGADRIDGGAGHDRVVYAGVATDYRVETLADGSIRVTDLREGSPDGIDLLAGIEQLSFADAAVTGQGEPDGGNGGTGGEEEPGDDGSGEEEPDGGSGGDDGSGDEEDPGTLPNRAPVAAADAVAVNEDATTANLWAQLLANDADLDLGDVLTIVSVGSSGTKGTLRFDAASQTLTYAADHDSFDLLASGATATDSFTYTVRDKDGLTSTATVTLTVTGVADGQTLAAAKKGGELTGSDGDDIMTGGKGKDRMSGGAGADEMHGGKGKDELRGGAGIDTLHGDAGKDRLFGEDGDDKLFGGSKRDWLEGGAGDDMLDGGANRDKLFGGDGNDMLDGGTGTDTLDGGAGNDVLKGGRGKDTLTGGAGADVFVFGANAGKDRITDFTVGTDSLRFEDGVAITDTRHKDVDKDGHTDTILTLSQGGEVILLGVAEYTGG